MMILEQRKHLFVNLDNVREVNFVENQAFMFVFVSYGKGVTNPSVRLGVYQKSEGDYVKKQFWNAIVEQKHYFEMPATDLSRAVIDNIRYNSYWKDQVEKHR